MFRCFTWLFVSLTIALGVGCSRRASLQPPKALLEAGWNQYSMGEYRQAIESFEAAHDASPETDANHLMALYGLATTWNLRMPIGDQNKGLAGEYYDRLIELNPAHDLAAWSLFAKARMLHLVPVGQTPDYDAVRAAYAQVYDRYPDHYAGQEAFIYGQASLVQTWAAEPAREAAVNLRAFVERHPESALLSAAHGILAVCYEIEGRPREQLRSLIAELDALIMSPDNPTQENSWRYWRIATLAEFEVGDFDIARQFYGRLLEEYPQDIRRYGAETALTRMRALEDKLRGSPVERGKGDS